MLIYVSRGEAEPPILVSPGEADDLYSKIFGGNCLMLRHYSVIVTSAIVTLFSLSTSSVSCNISILLSRCASVRENPCTYTFHKSTLIPRN